MKLNTQIVERHFFKFYYIFTLTTLVSLKTQVLLIIKIKFPRYFIMKKETQFNEMFKQIF